MPGMTRFGWAIRTRRLRFFGAVPRAYTTHACGVIRVLRRQREPVQHRRALAVIQRRSRQAAEHLGPEPALVHVTAQPANGTLQPPRNSVSRGLDGGHGVLLSAPTRASR